MDLRTRTFAALAVGLPILLALVHFRLGHHADIAFFHEWYLAFREGPAFYRDGPGVNYPIVGVLIVCGPAWLVDRATGAALELAGYHAVLKSTLVLGEIALVVTAAGLARELGHARPRTLAIALYALPSTWAGGAWFGQTDVFGTALLVACGWATLAYRRTGSTRTLALALLALHGALLAKQLTWFALPALGLALGVAIAARREPRHVALAIASLALPFAGDPLLVLPEGYHGHLHYVLARGAVHGQLAVASGASVWSLFVAGGTPASEVRLLGVDSFAWGWLGWSIAQGAALVRCVRRSGDGRSWIVAAGVGQLAMAVLLTGVHERYLAHAIPLLVLALGWTVPAVVVGVLGGLFVLATIHEDTVGATLLAHPAPLAIASLAWLVWVLRPDRGVREERLLRSSA